MSKLLRVGLIGAGYVSKFHVMGLRRVSDAELVGITDMDSQRAQAAAADAGVRAFTSSKELFAAGIDVAHVLTPPHTHAAVAIEALEHGCDVLVEKPLATSAEDCDRIAAAAERAGKLAAVNHSLLFDPFIQRALQAVRDGAVGTILSVDYFRSSEYPPYAGGPLPPQYRDGGFPFRDLGVHALYLMQAFLGRIQDVQASFRDTTEFSSAVNPHRKRDPNLLYDEWRATVQCARGTGQMQISWNVRPIQHQLFIQGTTGTLRVDLFSLFQARRSNTPLPKSIERAVNAMLESFQIGVQVPANAARFLSKQILPYHGLQDLIAEFYRALGESGEGLQSVPTIADARPIVEWTERVARQADVAKTKYLSQFPQSLTAPVLVTGATGFIGRHLVKRLLKDGHQLRLLVRRVPDPSLFDLEISGFKNVELVLGDLGDPATVEKAVAGTKLVFHLGAAMSGNQEEFQRSTAVGTRNIVESVLTRQAAKLVYVSSISVLHAAAATIDKPITEHWPLEPTAENRGFYTQTKLEAERLVLDAVRNRELKAVIVRPGQVFGPGAPLLTPAVARRAGKRLVILGNGEVLLPLVYVDDVVDALLLAAESNLFDGSVFHLVDGGAGVTQNELARLASNKEQEIVHVPLPLVYVLATGVEVLGKILHRTVPLSRYRVKSALAPLRFDGSAARDKLGWKPRVGVAEGLKRTVESQMAARGDSTPPMP